MVGKSRTIVKCAHQGCNYEGQRRLLKRHTDRKHPGCQIKYTNVLGIKELLSVINGATLPNNIQLSDLQNQLQLADLQNNLQSNDDADQPEPSTSSEEPMNISSDGTEQSEEPKSTNSFFPANDTFGTENSSIDLGEALKRIVTLAYQETLQKSITSTTNTSSTSTTTATTTSPGAFTTSERQCRSMETLVNEKGGLLISVPEQNIVYCKACKENAIGTATKYGIFPYNYGLGTSWKPGEEIPHEFRHLKFKIEKHWRTFAHQKNCRRLKKPDSFHDKKNSIIALRVLRTAYHVLKSLQHQEEFCNLIQLQSLNGMNLGENNTSAMLIDKLRDAFYDEIMHGIKTELINSELSNNLVLLADLTYARSSNSVATTAKLMCEALARLKKRKLVHSDIVLTEAYSQTVCTTLKEYKPYQNNICNDELFKFLWDKSAKDFKLKSYIRIVARLRLINPYENVVEPLASAIKDLFGDHRNSDHGNLAKELVIKWNGPPLNLAEPMLKSVQKRLNLKFTEPAQAADLSVSAPPQQPVLPLYAHPQYPLQPTWIG